MLIGYDPVANMIFGYPIGNVVGRTFRLNGGSPMMATESYVDGRLNGGNPALAVEDYPDGRLRVGDPHTL